MATYDEIVIPIRVVRKHAEDLVSNGDRDEYNRGVSDLMAAVDPDPEMTLAERSQQVLKQMRRHRQPPENRDET